MVGCLGRAGGLLWLALVLLEPDVGFRAPWAWMALFWALQIGIGIAVLQGVLIALTRGRGTRPGPTWGLVPAGGWQDRRPEALGRDVIAVASAPSRTLPIRSHRS